MKANRPVRNNNPGNLKFSSDQKAREAGALTRDEKGFGVFPDWVTGKRAADKLWDSMRDKGGSTIWTAVDRFTETEKKQRIDDLLHKARGWMDRDGKPVTQNTPLSKLTDEQFTTLRDYNNIQLEGWLNGLYEFSGRGGATSEWIQTPAGAHAPAEAGTRQPPPGNAPSPTGPVRPHSSLEAPQSLIVLHLSIWGPPARLSPWQGKQVFIPRYVMGSPHAILRPVRSVRGAEVSPLLTENPYVPGQGGPARPNLLASPSSFDSLPSARATRLRPLPSLRASQE